MTATKNLTKAMIPSQEEMVKNILTWHALAITSPTFEEDSEWYRSVHAECKAYTYMLNGDGITITLDQFIDVVAAVSPGLNWERNIYSAECVVRTWAMYNTLEERHAHFLTYKTGIAHGWRNFDRAWAILDGTATLDTKAPKTHAFGDNIRNPETSTLVTIDQHMIHIICDTGLRGSINPGNHYPKLAKAMRQAANILGMPMLKLQAAIWCCRVALFKAGYDVDGLSALLAEYGVE